MTEVDLLDDEPIVLRLNRLKAETLLRAIGRLDDATCVADIVEQIRAGLAPPDMSDRRVKGIFETKLFEIALHDLLGKIPGRWIVWLDGKVHADYATQAEAFEEWTKLAYPATGESHQPHIHRIEPRLGESCPGGLFVLPEFKKYEADWKHGWSYEERDSDMTGMGDFVPDKS